MIEKCKWHKSEKPIEDGETVGCPNCGTMLSTKDCEGCGKEFLDWEDRSFDDIIAGPYATASGDLACMRCGPRDDGRREEAEDQEAVYYGW
jgi:DNA-directed RNA polymerase subunit RPC12/RpoP